MGNIMEFQDTVDLEATQEVQEYNESLQASFNLPLKDHLNKLEQNIHQILRDLEGSRKEIVECDSAFKAFKDQYRLNNKLCGEMIVKEMGKTTEEFSLNMKNARNDLV